MAGATLGIGAAFYVAEAEGEAAEVW